jgi:iron complex transport system ATP-binding protein
MMATLEAHAIHVARGGRTILQDASLRVNPGCLTAVIGPNGSGKSTLLRALAGLWPVAQGEVSFNERPLFRLDRREIARRIAFVPQDTRIDFAFSVREIVGMGRHPHRGRFSPESAADRAAVDAAIERCDVAHLRERSANTLSGGERQRVVIARSLAAQPDVILLDEPTANLDIEHALDILELCRDLVREGHAVALAIHDLNAVARYADVVALIDRGRITNVGAPAEVLTPAAFETIFGVQARAVAEAGGSRQYIFERLPRNPL